MISLKWRIALVMFAGVLSLSSVSILKNRQFHFMGGMAEEYFGMGFNIFYHGQLSPTLIGARVFRPPGYPFFIAVVFRIWGGFPDEAEDLFTRDDLHQTRLNSFRAVCLAQGVLLSLTTVILFLYLAKYLRIRNAAVLAALFGCNPYLIILTGLFHYDMLHIFLTVVSIWIDHTDKTHQPSFTPFCPSHVSDKVSAALAVAAEVVHLFCYRNESGYTPSHYPQLYADGQNHSGQCSKQYCTVGGNRKKDGARPQSLPVVGFVLQRGHANISQRDRFQSVSLYPIR
jgi:hypothetical protein